MYAFGYLFIFAGMLVMRQVVAGRVQETPADLKALATAFLAADTAAMGDVLSARGTNVEVEGGSYGEVATTELPSTSTTQLDDIPANQTLARRVVELGNSARGYRLGAVGPTYYDCSGLIWRAAKDLGIYTGSRFTTSSFNGVAQGWVTKVTNPKPGDIVLWPTHHIGVLLGDDVLYSARSTAKGIGKSSVSGDSGYFRSQPEYWRVK